jgi:renal tumor antigen|tara:strand:- start:491 stop:1861 length:1371 start_codon:yes stop_codon:yes gene_type:complete
VNNLREIQALRRLSPHAHIITLEEVLYDQPTGRLALVFELMDANLYELIRGRRHYLNAQLIQSYMHQLLLALDHMHRKGIFHRDIKPENILIENKSDMNKGLKLADFGSCRGIYSKQPYTEYISTRWYRAPECLLTDGYYGPEMDLWGAGCVFFEITSLYPLFPGTNELDQINRIHKVLGTPDVHLLNKFKQNGAAHVNFDFPPQAGIGIAQLIKHAAIDCVELMIKMLVHDASERISAREALRHTYFNAARDYDARRQHALQPSTDLTHHSTANATPEKESMPLPTKGLPTIGGNAAYPSVNSAVNPKKGAKIMPQGSLTRAMGQTKYSTKDAHVDDIEASPSSLPPIMGVMGNSKMQQTYKYQTLDKKNGTKRKKRLKPFDNKHSYNTPNFSQGASISKSHVGGSILAQQGTSQNKSSNHFNFASQAKSGHLHGSCANTGRQSHIQVRYKKKGQ